MVENLDLLARGGALGIMLMVAVALFLRPVPRRKALFDWMTTVTHHDLHHARARYNMGLYFTWWDRWMGTEHPHYHEEFARAHGYATDAIPETGRA